MSFQEEPFRSAHLFTLRLLDSVFDESRSAELEGIAGCLDGGMEAWIAVRLEIADAERAREAIAEGVIILDVMEPNECEAEHVKGAIHCAVGFFRGMLRWATKRSACPRPRRLW